MKPKQVARALHKAGVVDDASFEKAMAQATKEAKEDIARDRARRQRIEALEKEIDSLQKLQAAASQRGRKKTVLFLAGSLRAKAKRLFELRTMR